jgi:hypothetical protein
MSFSSFGGGYLGVLPDNYRIRQATNEGRLLLSLFHSGIMAIQSLWIHIRLSVLGLGLKLIPRGVFTINAGEKNRFVQESRI